MRHRDEEKKVGIVFVADHWGTYTGGIDVFNESLCKEMAYVVDQACVSVICLVIGALDTRNIIQCKKQGINLVPYKAASEENDNDICRNARGLVVKEARCHYYIWVGHDVVTGKISYLLSKINEDDQFALILHTDYFSTHVNQEEKTEQFDYKTNDQVELVQKANWVFCVGPILYQRFKNYPHVKMIIPGLEINNKLKNKSEHHLIMMSGRFDKDTEHQKRWKESIHGIGKAIDIMIEKGVHGLDYQVMIYGFSENYTDEDLQREKNQLLTEIKKNTKNRVNMSLQLKHFDKSRNNYLRNLEKCSVFVMSSWIESFGLVAWEALEMGIPIVISENSGIYKYLDTELGYSLRGLCGSFDAGHGDVENEMGKAISEILLANKVAESAEKLRIEMIKKNRWEKCAIRIAKTMEIRDVMSDEVFTDSSYVGFIYSKREFMFDELKKRIENKRVNNRVVFFDGISNENILKDDEFFPSLFELLSGKPNIEVYLAYPTEKALAERISQIDKESVDIDKLKKKTKLIVEFKETFREKLSAKNVDFEEKIFGEVLERIYLVPLDKSPNVYINIVDADWYFTIKYEKRSSDNATIKLQIEGSKEGERQKESLREYMEFILKASRESEGSKQMLAQLNEW